MLLGGSSDYQAQVLREFNEGTRAVSRNQPEWEAHLDFAPKGLVLRWLKLRP